MDIAAVLSWRTTCGRKAVGCVITDEDGFILSTGYNGVPKGTPHCAQLGCKDLGDNTCGALHAEQNAIARLRSVGHTLYCTTEPCRHCTKLIIAARIKRVVYSESYPDKRIENNIAWIKI